MQPQEKVDWKRASVRDGTVERKMYEEKQVKQRGQRRVCIVHYTLERKRGRMRKLVILRGG